MINKLSLQPQAVVNAVQPKNTTASAAEVSNQFGKFLSSAIENLNQGQANVEKLNTQFIKGDITDVHQVMIATEKASLGLELTVQVRNKMIEAYQEIMRMQV
ncbi:flagellar hook-basal body complex protein FliE [Paenibacillus mucilaginosus]|uniref:Flagellar hook-basal body complex protein FliE n=3 Tax=Paenibacillus mucilaginosus TaxID=61624 RepID=H6NQ59_9BACL|nr:flagellar hook-basal body complex protein FliE [Paenibacillus mucilaginosus]AEI44345.1 flagellar hook-basal body protein FliE [Paenibacillus mucilaginosus KNP414]AFC31883.1 flagellar hook-basal body protein FliE [Paenibacillus mucilaginosus 3016]AFH64240.1 flagellar hook-basal body protein FliE [Paenibacillus mucilaginosus K02]MCG7217601.1 flagellar hook-basal body complex protein FliE [Paenibacillus mucilaginosus]WDM25741.1 flagellar hook-basal body complex protein FliE [Paenibacillus muci